MLVTIRSISYDMRWFTSHHRCRNSKLALTRKCQIQSSKMATSCLLNVCVNASFGLLFLVEPVPSLLRAWDRSDWHFVVACVPVCASDIRYQLYKRVSFCCQED